MVANMLDGIEVRLDTDYFENKTKLDALADKIVYTGAIDAYFEYQLGALEYRSVRFETEVLDKPNFQGNAAVNYTDRETPWTRIIEHKWFEFGKDDAGNDIPKTVISREYSSEWKVGDVVTRVRELETVRQFITGSALTLVLDAIFTIVYIAAMFMYSTSLSLIVLLILPVYIVLNLLITPIYHKRINDNFDANADNQAFLIETVTGIQAVKSLAVENHLRQKWEQMLSRYIKKTQ